MLVYMCVLDRDGDRYPSSNSVERNFEFPVERRAGVYVIHQLCVINTFSKSLYKFR